MPAAVGPEDLLAGEQALHRAARLHRELGDDEFEAERVRLSAEGAPEERLDDPDLRLRQLEHPSELPMDVVRNLSRGPDRQVPTRIVVANRAVRLDRGVRRALVEELLIGDRGGPREPTADVAKRELDVLGDVSVLGAFVNLVPLLAKGVLG